MLVEDTIFSFPSANATPAASRSFTCVHVDVSTIDARLNSLINSASAPQVILIGKDRNQVVALKGKSKLTDVAISTEMRKLLDAPVNDGITQRIAAIEPTLKDMRELQKKIRAKTDLINKIREMPAKDPQSITAKTDRLSQEDKLMKELDQQLEAFRDRLAD
jgi:hypothetical protein